MNPKGEEGEFYMKKSLLVLASIMILALCTFVACTAEVSDPYDGLTYVTFGGESPASRNLLASYEVASYDSLYWFYTAEKKDNYGTSGAVANEPVHEGNTGLNNTVGPFSQGKWLFTLCAYKNNAVSEDAKVYEGSVVVSLKGQKVTVPVSVTPYGKNGSLEFKDAYFAWKDNAESSTGIPVITIVAEGTTTGQKYTLSNSFTADIEGVGTTDMKIRLALKARDGNGRLYIDEENARFDSVVADYYKCSIIAYIDIDGSQTPIFSQTFGFRVYGSTTTTISGDITEGEFTGVDFSVENMAVIEMSESFKASLSVTPSGVEGKTTDVDFSNADLSGKHVLVVDVDSVTEASNFKIEGVDPASQSIVAGIGLELFSVGETTQTPVTSFGDGNVIVTTYIAKGLENVTVKYNGTNGGGDPTNVQYYKSTGELTFTTTHFSEFYVVADKIEAIDITHNEAVTSLVSIYPSDYNNSTIVLVDDVENFAAIYDGVSNLTIDLNSHKIIGNGIAHFVFDLYRESILQESSVSFVGKGSIVCNTPSDEVSSSVFVVRNRGVLTIGPDIVLEGPNGILIDKDSSNFHNNSGAIVNFKGTINVSEDKGFGITVNGSNSYTGDDAPDFNLDGAKINVPNGVGIYAAGYANWNISGNTEITGYNTAIEIRAGNMTIDSGTFKSTATAYSCSKNDGGATTTGAAIAVAQHNTNLPIDVVITGTPKLSGVYGLSVTNPQGNTKDAISNVKVTINDNVENLYVSTDFIREGNVIRAKTTEDDSKYVACLSTGFNFISLKDAVEAVTDSGYITLLQTVDNGDGILIPEGNKNITIDFNKKTYSVTQNFIEDKNSGINLGKGNHITFKNGVIASNSKKISTLVQNYSNLEIQDVILDGLTGGSFGQSVNGVCSVLSCNHGKTVITGKSDIKGRSGNGFRTVDVTCLRSDFYNEVSVLFDSNYTGSVCNRVYFDSEQGISNLDGYTHSLVIDAGNFDNATFYLQEIRGKSLFKIKNQITFSSSSASYKVVLVDEYKTLADEVIYNETSDTRYTDFHTAITNSLTSEQLRFVLKGECVTGRYCTNINGGRVVTLDLQGNRIKAHTLSDSNAMFSISDGTLNIVDSSVVKGSIDSSDNLKISYCIAVDSNGSFNVESGIIIKAAEGKKAATGWSSEIITEGYSYHSN